MLSGFTVQKMSSATSKFTLGALLIHNDNVVAAIRRELRRVVDVLVDDEAIINVLRSEVVKRDVLEGVAAEYAANRVNRTEARSLRGSRTPAAEPGD